jgi:predicted transcriptional regulator
VSETREAGAAGDDRTLHVRVESLEDALDRSERAVQAIASGEEPADEDRFGLSIAADAEAARIVSEANLALLRAIAREEPAGIRATARLVDRDPAEVKRNLDELAALGLVRYVEEGRAKRPTVWFDRISVEIPLRDAGDAV